MNFIDRSSPDFSTLKAKYEPVIQSKIGTFHCFISLQIKVEKAYVKVIRITKVRYNNDEFAETPSTASQRNAPVKISKICKYWDFYVLLTCSQTINGCRHGFEPASSYI